MTADAILAECIGSPDDDAPRVAWADAIGGDRGELVTLQCTGRTPMHRVRERELLAAHGRTWSGLATHAQQISFRRGFVDATEVHADMFLAFRRADRRGRTVAHVADRVRAASPGVTAGGRSRRRAPVARGGGASSEFARIRALDLADDIDGRWADAAAGILAGSGGHRPLRRGGACCRAGLARWNRRGVRVRRVVRWPAVLRHGARAWLDAA